MSKYSVPWTITIENHQMTRPTCDKPGKNVFAGIWISECSKLSDHNTLLCNSPHVGICFYKPKRKIKTRRRYNCVIYKRLWISGCVSQWSHSIKTSEDKTCLIYKSNRGFHNTLPTCHVTVWWTVSKHMKCLLTCGSRWPAHSWSQICASRLDHQRGGRRAHLPPQTGQGPGVGGSLSERKEYDLHTPHI